MGKGEGEEEEEGERGEVVVRGKGGACVGKGKRAGYSRASATHGNSPTRIYTRALYLANPRERKNARGAGLILLIKRSEEHNV